MKYCSQCKKVVNIIEENVEFSNNLDMIIEVCEECRSFICQYLIKKDE